MSRDKASGQFLAGESAHHPGQFKPGNPGGPGRPRGLRSLTSGMKDKLDTPATLGAKDGKPQYVLWPDDVHQTQEDGSQILLHSAGERMTWRDFLVDRWFVNSARGNARATMEILDRIDGKVKQTLALEGVEGGAPISVNDARSDIRNALAALKPRKAQRTRQGKASKETPS